MEVVVLVVLVVWWGHFSFSEMSVLVTFEFSIISVMVTYQFW